ncbi:DUF4190 domain-containing protein [Xanthomonas sp. NCPPB 2654]|uniref:DUF4190 domain-containing protein n=1 Tax=unclassified Xanthomonas TaxID=2643310 RepID=UPI0021E0AE6D|nr:MULTISPECIES: DUF4190 domain-containing protein [unclassified Xanthomonas]MDL5367477.1 DUF4190 domain-containing protein [Xanthomonas sp. NCPPB 2654]MDR6672936.1 hypothetical protein [Xanthomonas translucens]MEB1528734.1 DUF4190 domain-containing protein [Xanthomonas campestris pv. campestris]UYC22557.1 DUF4190 domain-containing protein [Xanthomonas sp. CFBP 8443]
MNAVRETNSLAVVSLIAGILGWTLMPVLGSLGAIIAGHLARAEIRRQPQRFQGDGLAVGGLLLGWLAVIVAVVVVLAFVAFFGGLAWLASIQG